MWSSHRFRMSGMAGGSKVSPAVLRIPGSHEPGSIPVRAVCSRVIDSALSFEPAVNVPVPVVEVGAPQFQIQ